jgi:hypothetical protein
MGDMLVQLLKLPPAHPLVEKLRRDGVIVRRARSFELSRIRGFVESEFHISWADEITVGFARLPITVFIATRKGEVIGFGAYECTTRAFFGPTGVVKRERGREIGKAILLSCLHGLREMGYAYGIIGAPGPIEFYEKAVNAVAIADSTPGFYVDPLSWRKKKTTPTPRSKRRS